MSCDTYEDEGGGTFILCSRGRGGRKKLCQVLNCTRPGERECDWPMDLGLTCDRLVCREHAHRHGTQKIALVGGFKRVDSVDYCPEHHAKATANEVAKPETVAP